MNFEELKEFLDYKVIEFNSPNFIETDPIQIPHKFQLKEDIEIIGFIMATISWGKRQMIIRNGEKLARFMGNSPYDFVMTATADQLEDLEFIHRTFNTEDLKNFILAIRELYLNHSGIEGVFKEAEPVEMQCKISHFHKVFTNYFSLSRTNKHVANPAKGSASKRMVMYLRWMCRKDNTGVDFGLWNAIKMEDLHIPLDVHSGNVARKLGLLHRNQNDWKAVEELQAFVSKLDPKDPSKYDFALFGLGAFEGF